MKLKTTFLSLIAFCLIFNAEAKLVSLNDAENIARNFIYFTSNKYDTGIAYDKIKLSDPYIYTIDDQPVFYAFQMTPGFIIISADDAYVPVIGYSFEGRFDFENADPNYKGFIKNYGEQIAFARANNVLPGEDVNAAWAELRDDNILISGITRDRDVEPLLDNTWDQGDPYNYYCPADAAGPGGHCWAGCVATAMAQIMYYWRYPVNGTSQHCYIPGNYSYGEQCADFANTYYDWTGMINTVDNKNPFANAELQYHCAVSVNMNFGTTAGSGAQSSSVPNALYMYFRYLTAQYREKGNYTLTGWISLLKADIDVGKPVYYSGYSPSEGGHAFVCDGYQGDNFHFNFGWSGYGNGYYSLSDVNGFNVNQACVRGFSPSDAGYPYHNTGTVNVTSTSGSITDGSGPVANYIDNNNAFWLIDPQTVYDSITNITLTFSDYDVTAGDSIKVYNGGTVDAPLLGAYSATMPPALTTTGNQMLIQFKTNGSGNGKGWYAQYSTTSPSWCQGLVQFTDPSKTFNDGSGYFYYQNGATCMWRIKPLYANKITLTFNYFETEPDIDKLSVYDGNTLLATLSGSEMPDPLVANSGTMFMTWSTNINTTFQGWEAYYEVDNVGISDAAPVTELSVYPNPASEKLHVEFQMASTDDLKIRLVNITGQTVLSEEYPQFTGNFQEELSIGSLPSGIYFLEINSTTGSANKKIFINR